MKTIENKGLLPVSHAIGQSVPVKTPHALQIDNKINGFEHISYGSALKNIYKKFGIHKRAGVVAKVLTEGLLVDSILPLPKLPVVRTQPRK